MSEKTDSTEQACIPEGSIHRDEPAAVKVWDNSMAGIVWEGDVIFVDATKTMNNGDLCLVWVRGIGNMIRHVFISPGEVTLVSTVFAPIRIPRKDLHDLQRVVAVSVKGKNLRQASHSFPFNPVIWRWDDHCPEKFLNQKLTSLPIGKRNRAGGHRCTEATKTKR